MPFRGERTSHCLLSSGTPVAAYPVEGPVEVVGSPAQGGVLDENLTAAWYVALSVPRQQARARALVFGWAHASRLFMGYLVPSKHGGVLGYRHESTADVI